MPSVNPLIKDSSLNLAQVMQQPLAASLPIDSFQRHFVRESASIDSVLNSVPTRSLDVSIKDLSGQIAFSASNIIVPDSWSDDAARIAASKYFYDLRNRTETSAIQMIRRVCHAIARAGLDYGYFDSQAEAEYFGANLAYLLAYQYAAFNSPVWFNVGLHDSYGVQAQSDHEAWRLDPFTGSAYRVNPLVHPQVSACYIVSVEDSISSILNATSISARIFKYGSGFGADFSELRSSYETISGGGVASGPVSFMRLIDTVGMTIRSGGRTRRAANMFTLSIHHPDAPAFLAVKAREEDKARVLVQAGYSGGIDGEAYATVAFQNANISIRLSDAFMDALAQHPDEPWAFTARYPLAKPLPTFTPRQLFDLLCTSARRCGDPGVQFSDTINSWHTTPSYGPIVSSNPCSEYLHVNDSACNLSSINLFKFRTPTGFDFASFVRAVRIMTIAQDILVTLGSYPSKPIAERAASLRQLGLGYSNLGALLMSLGLPYDSPAARSIAAGLTALLTAEAYRTSAFLARRLAPYTGYDSNRSQTLAVLNRHRQSVSQYVAADGHAALSGLRTIAQDAWDQALQLAETYGVRNAQATVLAPTGTISFLMDCYTTGIEPELALVKYKTLVGGGVLKLVNPLIAPTLRVLGYSEADIAAIVAHVEKTGAIEDCPLLKPNHVAIFDCSFQNKPNGRFLSWQAHVEMMAHAQPFLSGGISKTVNLPASTTVEDIASVYRTAHQLGLKAIAVYVDGCKESQPLTTASSSTSSTSSTSTSSAFPSLPTQTPAPAETALPSSLDQTIRCERKRLPQERPSITRKFSIAGCEGYIHIGQYEDGSPGELFVNVSKQGSTISGLMDAIGILTSLCLQYGVPLPVLVEKLSYMRFPPSGFTGDQDIPIAYSIVDYVFRYLGLRFLKSGSATSFSPYPNTQALNLSGVPEDNEANRQKSDLAGLPSAAVPGDPVLASFSFSFGLSGPGKEPLGQVCPKCGAVQVILGKCLFCPSCGETNGGCGG